MNGTAWNEVRFTRANGHSFSIYRKSEDAFNSADGFVVMFVLMPQRNFGTNRNHKLKHGDGTVRVGSFGQEVDS